MAPPPLAPATAGPSDRRLAVPPTDPAAGSPAVTTARDRRSNGLPSAQTATLADTGYAAGNLDRDLGPDLTRSPAWQLFCRSWDHLPRDTYMADGGTYRRRRFSELACEGTTGEVHLLPHHPFSQPRHINPLNGGVERLFDPIEPATVANPVLRRIVLSYVRTFDRIQGPGRWLAQCFQNRTLAHPETPGLPTPEGVHRDGMDYNVAVLVRRDGVVGGVSRLYDGQTRTRKGEVLLAEPADHVVMDDRRLLHDVTPVAVAGAGRTTPGTRDALVISFTRIT